jgi:acyl carrier protein
MNKKNEIILAIIDYLKTGNPVYKELKEIPLNESLVELGYMDSFGIIDIVTYLEGSYSIKINDDEITKEKFGSINKMAKIVLEKI